MLENYLPHVREAVKFFELSRKSCGACISFLGIRKTEEFYVGERGTPWTHKHFPLAPFAFSQ